MKNVSYTSLQMKYPGQLVALLEKEGQVVAAGKTTRQIERVLREKGIDPSECVFLGPLVKYGQVSVY